MYFKKKRIYTFASEYQLAVRSQIVTPQSSVYSNTGLFEIIVGVLTICHTQYT